MICGTCHAYGIETSFNVQTVDPTDFRPYAKSHSEKKKKTPLLNVPAVRIRRRTHLYSQKTLLQIGKTGECALSKINMFGAFGTSCTRVDNPGEHTFLGRVAH